MNRRYLKTASTLAAMLLLAACASGDPAYTKAKDAPPLEVPPDLNAPHDNNPFGTVPIIDPATGASRPSGNSGMVGAGATGSVLPNFKALRIERAGSQRWLVVHAEAEPLWYEIRNFILKNNFLIAKQSPKTGILETEWREHRPLVASKAKNTLSKALGSLYSTGLRDKFRVRLERGQDPGTMEIFISHRGMEEVIATGGGTEVIETRWQPRAPDPELEIEFLGALMVSLGEDGRVIKQLAKAAKSKAPAAVKRNRDGVPVLQLENSFDIAWRQVGLALDRVGFVVEDRDRSKGVYYVRYQESKDKRKKGIFASLFGGNKDKAEQYYQISIRATADRAEVQVLDQSGSSEKSKTGEKILTLLQDELK